MLGAQDAAVHTTTEVDVQETAGPAKVSEFLCNMQSRPKKEEKGRLGWSCLSDVRVVPVRVGLLYYYPSGRFVLCLCPTFLRIKPLYEPQSLQQKTTARCTQDVARN